MPKIHYVNNKGTQGCTTKPWWHGIVSKPGVYEFEDGGELHADSLPTSNDWNEVTCKICLRQKEAQATK